MQNIGKVIQITGPAVDVQFAEGALPPIYTAVRVTSEGFNVPQPIDVVLEVQQHLGEGRVRAIAMQATEGMVRGMMEGLDAVEVLVAGLVVLHRLGRLTEQNPASGVHDWLVLRMPDCFADRRYRKGPRCQNSCLHLRYFLPACPLL